MMNFSTNVQTIVKNLNEAKITKLTPTIRINLANINFYLGVLETKYPNLGNVLANCNNVVAVGNIFKTFANGEEDSPAFYKALYDVLFDENIKIIWNTLIKANIDSDIITRDEIAFHIKYASNYFPDIAYLLALIESPMVLKQAIESVLSYDDNRLKRFLDFARETYVDISA